MKILEYSFIMLEEERPGESIKLIFDQTLVRSKLVHYGGTGSEFTVKQDACINIYLSNDHVNPRAPDVKAASPPSPAWFISWWSR